MGSLVSFFLVTFAGLLAVSVLLLSAEILAAIAQPRRQGILPSNHKIDRRIAVLVPAHNEGTGLLATLADIKAQLRSTDRLLVVADNCTDDTAAVAKAAGAEVTERSDPSRIGKGYALAWGLHYLSVDPPDIVVMIDADCSLTNDALDKLRSACETAKRPIQALVLMTGPTQSPIDYRVAEFALRVKNLVRPLGLRAVKLPCQLMGSGMAFPWEVISSVDVASGNIVEDLKLGLDLTRAGYPPLFYPFACFMSSFPSSILGSQSQRTRWEHGHLGTIATTLPGLACEAIVRGNFPLLVLALDAAIPPITLLGILIGLTSAASTAAVMFGLSQSALVISISILLIYLLSIVVCWLKFGRDILPPSALLSMPSYAVSKMFLYGKFFSGRTSSQWIRTDRRKFGEDGN